VRRLLALCVIALSAVTIPAAESDALAKPGVSGRTGEVAPEMQNSSDPHMLKDNPLFQRMALNQEQLGKIEKVLSEASKTLREALEKIKSEGNSADAVRLKEKEYAAECKKKIRESLPAELQAKFDAGMKILEEAAAKMKTLQDELVTARAQAGGDQDKFRKAERDIVDKYSVLEKEMYRELDEKVGKVPEPPLRK
jgi:hypothetical protein